MTVAVTQVSALRLRKAALVQANVPNLAEPAMRTISADRQFAQSKVRTLDGGGCTAEPKEATASLEQEGDYLLREVKRAVTGC